MFGALLILFPLSLLSSLDIRSNRYRPLLNILFWIFAFNFLLLGWLGAKPAEEPYVSLAMICTILYFSYFIIILSIPLIPYIIEIYLSKSLWFIISFFSIILIILIYIFIIPIIL